MSRFTSKAALLADIDTERRKLTELLAEIPPEARLVEVTDGMSVKDFLAHRAEWGRMFERWYAEAVAGGTPAVPSERYTWRQLPALNAEIHERHRDVPLDVVEQDFADTADRLRRLVEGVSDEDLFQRHRFSFTGSTDLAAYLNSATAAHYRSARTHIRRWWRARR